jgi:Short C-terminal domain
MGFLRKTLIISTGGLAPVKGRSYRERTARATEKQVRLQEQILRADQQTVAAVPESATGWPVPTKTEYETFPRCSVARLQAAATQTVTEMGYSLAGGSPGVVLFRTGWSMSSFGQAMTARIIPDADGTKVEIGGKPKNGQPYDWGESLRIARKVIEKLYAVVNTTPEPAQEKAEGSSDAIAASVPIRPDTGPTASTGAAPGSTAGEIERLAQLHTQGALTDEEFAAAKAKILGMAS